MNERDTTAKQDHPDIEDIYLAVSDATGLCSVLAGYTTQMGGQDPEVGAAITVLHTQLKSATALVENILGVES